MKTGKQQYSAKFLLKLAKDVADGSMTLNDVKDILDTEYNSWYTNYYSSVTDILNSDLAFRQAIARRDLQAALNARLKEDQAAKLVVSKMKQDVIKLTEIAFEPEYDWIFADSPRGFKRSYIREHKRLRKAAEEENITKLALQGRKMLEMGYLDLDLLEEEVNGNIIEGANRWETEIAQYQAAIEDRDKYNSIIKNLRNENAKIIKDKQSITLFGLVLDILGE